MKQKRAPYLIYIYILFLLIGRSFTVLGKYSVLLVLIPIMLCQLILTGKGKIHKSISTVNIIYLVYIIWFIFAGIINGDFTSSSDTVPLLVNYITCVLIASLISSKINTVKHINNILSICLMILIVNIILSILQFLNIQIGWTIWEVFNPSINSAAEVRLQNLVQGQEQELGINFSPGLFLSIVTNGYFMASFGLLPLVLAAKSSSVFRRTIMYFIYVASLITLFIIQQRAAFFIFIFFSLVILYKTAKQQKGAIFVSLIVILLILTTFDGSIELGRLSETSLEEDNRYDLFRKAVDYISNHFMFGGRVDFVSYAGWNAHNFIFNSFIYSGFIGAILLIFIAYKMLALSLKMIISNSRFGLQSLFFSCALLAYLAIGLLHNESLVTGTPTLFILYSLLVITMDCDKYY